VTPNTQEPDSLLKQLRDIPKDYLGEPIPAPTDSIMDHVLRVYLDSSATKRLKLRQRLDFRCASVLLVYAQRLASRAVRSESVDSIFDGLVAAGLTVGAEDPREILQVLAPLYHSAKQLQIDPRALFERAGDRVGPDARKFFDAFLDRPDLDNILSEMEFVESRTEDGFTYLRSWEVPLR
jgi:hypothetical protein